MKGGTKLSALRYELKISYPFTQQIKRQHIHRHTKSHLQVSLKGHFKLPFWTGYLREEQTEFVGF